MMTQYTPSFALKRAIYIGRVAATQARRVDEMQAVADALSLLANIVMAWNTAQMQAVLGEAPIAVTGEDGREARGGLLRDHPVVEPRTRQETRVLVRLVHRGDIEGWCWRLLR
jgi:hypothetical protein